MNIVAFTILETVTEDHTGVYQGKATKIKKATQFRVASLSRYAQLNTA